MATSLISVMPSRLMRYIGRHYFNHLAGTAGALIFIAGLFDMIELFRRSTGKEAVTAATVIQMTFYKLPVLVQELLPFIVLFGGLISFFKLTRAKELIVARSVGISIWQILAAPVMISFFCGIFLVVMLNPIAASFYQAFERMENRLLELKKSDIEISRTGLWLRDVQQNRASILNSEAIEGNIHHLKQVVFYRFDEEQQFLYRLTADEAILQEQSWYFPQVVLNAPGKPAQSIIDHREPTNLSLKTIEQNFASQEALSFWDLPDYINQLQNAGFNTAHYRLKWHSLLATPLLLGAMALIAAIFTIRAVRVQRLTIILLGGVTTGFGLFLFTKLLNALGLNQTIPVIVAGWFPACAALLVAVGLLLHLEDG